MVHFQPIEHQALCLKKHVKNIQSNIIASPHDEEGNVNVDFDSRQQWLTYEIKALPAKYRGPLKVGDTVLVNKHYTLKQVMQFTLIYINLIEFKITLADAQNDEDDGLKPLNPRPKSPLVQQNI